MTTERTKKLAARNLFGELIAMRDEQREQRGKGLQVVKEKDLPLETNQMGQMKWYMHPNIKDLCVNMMMVYQQEIPPGSRSGRIKFQGGQVIMILEGQGYTSIDGVKHSWKKGDVLNLPLRDDGIIVQHFNTDTKETAKFLAVEPNWFDALSVDRGCGFEIQEEAPEHMAQKNG
jgi:gentisate 1,2-dioxygenase